MDRNEVIKEIEELLNGYPVFIPEAAKRGLSDALALLKDYDTQLQYRDDHIAEYEKEIKRLEGKEQEAVVRCKDCRYWLPMNRFHEDYHPGNGECELNCWVRQMDWFCADGERKGR